LDSSLSLSLSRARAIIDECSTPSLSFRPSLPVALVPWWHDQKRGGVFALFYVVVVVVVKSKKNVFIKEVSRHFLERENGLKIEGKHSRGINVDQNVKYAQKRERERERKGKKKNASHARRRDDGDARRARDRKMRC